MEKLHPPLCSQSGGALHVEFPTEFCSDTGASAYEWSRVAFLIRELCASCAAYSHCDAQIKICALVGEREGLYRP